MRSALLVVVLVACGGNGPGTAPNPPEPDMDAPCSELDRGGNGTVDVVYTYAYDDDGYLTSYRGTPADNGDYTYDDNHFVLHYTNNADADAAIEYEEIYTRDGAGRVLTYQQRNADGSLDTETYSYDASGRVTRLERTGAVRSVTEYVYTGSNLNPTSGRMTYPSGSSRLLFTSSNGERTRHTDIDDGEDGSIDRTSDIEYDDERRVVSSIDRSAGAVVQRVTRTYTPRGHLLAMREADGDVGTPDDWVFSATYDLRGMLANRTTESPSGKFANNTYEEHYKSQCGIPSAR